MSPATPSRKRRRAASAGTGNEVGDTTREASGSRRPEVLDLTGEEGTGGEGARNEADRVAARALAAVDRSGDESGSDMSVSEPETPGGASARDASPPRGREVSRKRAPQGVVGTGPVAAEAGASQGSLLVLHVRNEPRAPAEEGSQEVEGEDGTSPPGSGEPRASADRPAGEPPGEGSLDFPSWLSLRHVPAAPDGRLRPDLHQTQRERYLQELAEARAGAAHFRACTGEHLRDDRDRYLEWEPGPHWDRNTWVRDVQGRWWRGASPSQGAEVRPPGEGGTGQAPNPGV